MIEPEEKITETPQHDDQTMKESNEQEVIES